MGQAYAIVGKECGRDAHGVFHCRCGKCRELPQDDSQNRGNSGNNGGNSGNDANNSRDDESSFFRSFS